MIQQADVLKDAKRWRAMMLLVDDQKAIDLIEASGIVNDMEDAPTSAIAVDAIDKVIIILEENGFDI